MKKAAVIIGVLCLLTGAIQADIGVRGLSSGGVYLEGGSWIGGPWPVDGALYQLIWSPVEPVTADISDLAGHPGEVILFAGPTTTYGYANPSPLVEVFDAAANDGWVFMRIFESIAPVEGDLYYQSAPTAPRLPDYDPLVVTSSFDHQATPGGAQMSANEIIPEPATLALWGLGLLTIVVRRKIRR